MLSGTFGASFVSRSRRSTLWTRAISTNCSRPSSPKSGPPIARPSVSSRTRTTTRMRAGTAVSHRLREADIVPPGALSPGGTIIDTTPRIGVWLMPDNRSAGEIEDFVQQMIQHDDPAWPLAQRYIRDIPEEARKFRPHKTSRAELHAWLATREEPGFMGSAIGRGDLETGGPLCTEFAEWIERLFA